MRDLIERLNRTRRTVGSGDLHGSGAHVVDLSRRLRAPVNDVWDACTDPERVGRWFLPLTGDLRAGGTFELQGNAHGAITTCEPPTRLELTWCFGDMEPSAVALELAAVDDDSTMLSLRHTVPDDEHWSTYGPGAVGVGWDLALTALEQRLAPDGVDQPGPEFLRACAQAWGTAHQAAGAPADQATPAAARTGDFYAPPAGTGH